MRIGIEINGVLRNTLGKVQQVYEKSHIQKMIDDGDEFEYEVLSPVESLDLKKHLKFRDNDHLYDFLFKEHTMEIFGHAGSVEMNGMNDLNDFYLNFRDENDIILFSDEIGKSKPATLFFISKFGCLVEEIKFYSESTKNRLWDGVDILLTANPDLLLNYPEGKVVIKYKTKYNEYVECGHVVETIKELNEIIKQILC